jgi:hypothetical protein
MYERILTNIPEPSWKLAHRTFQWLSESISENPDLSCSMLAVAVVLPDHGGRFVSKNQLLGISELSEICTCLIGDIANDLRPKLAHYTVKEFLYADRIRTGKAQRFRSSAKAGRVLFAETVLTSLLYEDYQTTSQYSTIDPASIEWSVSGYQQFLEFALSQWKECVREVGKLGGDDRIYDLVFELLDPLRSGFVEFRRKYNECRMYEPLSDFVSSKDSRAGVILAYLGEINLMEAAKVYIQRHPELMADKYVLNPGPSFTPVSSGAKMFLGDSFTLFRFFVQCSVHPREAILPFLLQEGRLDVDRLYEDGYCVMGAYISTVYTKRFRYVHDSLQSMLEMGAKINRDDVTFTPLQLAVICILENRIRRDRLLVLKFLVEKGADVNAVGNYNVIVHLHGSSDTNHLKNFDTPLKLLEDGRETYSSGVIIDGMVEFLKKEGAISTRLSGETAKDRQTLQRLKPADSQSD